MAKSIKKIVHKGMCMPNLLPRPIVQAAPWSTYNWDQQTHKGPLFKAYMEPTLATPFNVDLFFSLSLCSSPSLSFTHIHINTHYQNKEPRNIALNEQQNATI